MWKRVNGNTWREGEVYKTYRTISKDAGFALVNFRKEITNRDGLTFKIHVEKAKGNWAVMVAEYKPYPRKAWESHQEASYLLSTIYEWWKKGQLKY